MLYLSIVLGLGLLTLAYLYNRQSKSVAKLEYTIRGRDKTIDILERQNETLAKAIKRSDPDYDVDRLFNGGF